MERQAARNLLAGKVAASSRPVLLDTELDALLDSHARTDPAGRPVTDASWEGSWNLNAAAAEGWRWKAGRVAGDYSFSADDASYSKGDVLAHCEAMAAQYAALDHGSLDPMTADSTDYRARALWL